MMLHHFTLLYIYGSRRTLITICFYGDRVIMSERSSSLLRSKKVTSERDMHLSLWKNYVVMGCCIAPPSHPIEHHSASPDPTR